MPDLRMRPRFERHLPCSPSEVLRRLESFIDRSDTAYTGEFYPNHAIINVPSSEQHFWSPQLTIDLTAVKDGTLLRGLYAPRPSVWTMFMAMYAIAGFGGLIGVLFGTSQWSLGMSATGLWAAPGAVAMAAGVYGLAQFGQWLSRDQMTALRAFTDRAIERCAAGAIG